MYCMITDDFVSKVGLDLSAFQNNSKSVLIEENSNVVKGIWPCQPASQPAIARE